MYLSQPKTNFIKVQNSSTFYSKENIAPSTKLNIYPPKMHRVSSIGSNLYLDSVLHKSLQKQNKPYRDILKSKDDILQPKNTINSSFNTTYDVGKFSKDFNTHRYSCNIDIDRNSDKVNVNGPSGASYEKKTCESDLLSRVKELEQKMKKNEQNLKFYTEQVQHFKHQFSASASNLMDSINTNILTGSTREPLRQTSNILNLNNHQNNKQNVNKNILTAQSVTNSPRQDEINKKLKQIDHMKKQLKKITFQQESMKGEMKKIQARSNEILNTCREYMFQFSEKFTKIQEKHKKKLFDKLTEQVDKKFKQFLQNQLDPIKKILENTKHESLEKKNTFTIKKSTQKFINDPIMIKLKEETYCLVKRENKCSPFESYQDMIKRNVYESMAKSSSNLTYPRSSVEFQKQTNDLEYSKVSFEQIQTTYFIDEEGFLLDSSGYYLLKSQQKIKLNDVQLQKLHQNQILKQIQKGLILI